MMTLLQILRPAGIIKIITDEPTLEDALDFDKVAAHHLADIIRNSSPRFAIRVFGGGEQGRLL